MLTLGVLDQLPVFSGRSAPDAVRDSLALAVAVEEEGFARFWLAEHHGDPSLACAAPEVLAAAVAVRTRTMRVGTGCVLLPHTTPLRVAEGHRLLQALAPGRVELGVGRGQGAAGATAAELAATAPQGQEDHVVRTAQLLHLLERPVAPDPASPLAVPADVDPPQVWVMGAGPGGALTAAALGLPLALAHFAHGRPQPQLVHAYRAAFRPSAHGGGPRVAVAVRVACAPDRRTAELLARCVWMPALASGGPGARSGWDAPVYPSLADAAAHVPSRGERAVMEAGADLVVTGEPPVVHARLVEIARAHGTDEVVVTTACPDPRLRIEAHRLLAAEARLPRPR